MRKRMHLIYTLTFPCGVYVGASSSVAERWRNHRRRLVAGRSQRLLQGAYDAHGEPTMQIVACGFSHETLHELEKQVIDTVGATLNETTPSPLNALGWKPANKRQRRPLPPGVLYDADGVYKPWGPHRTVKDAARYLGVTYAVAKRAARRMSYEAFVEKLRLPKKPIKYRPPAPHDAHAKAYAQLKPFLVCIDGVADTVSGHCFRLGISHIGARKRIRRGDTTWWIPKSGAASTQFGPYASIGQAAKAIGVSHSYLAKVANSGITYEDYIHKRNQRAKKSKADNRAQSNANLKSVGQGIRSEQAAHME